MFQPIRVLTDALPERVREGLGRRATGLVAALFIEALLFLFLLGLGRSANNKQPPLVTLSSFDVQPPEPKQAPAKQEAAPTKSRQPTLPVPQPLPPTPVQPPPQPAATPPPLLALPRDQANFSLANLPKSPAPPAKATPAYGPADTGSVGDSERVGTAPDGSALYGAAWVREPTSSELAAYNARMQTLGSGWGEINCKTAPDFRVVDCVVIGESPENSHLANAVLSAAWQFKVRPPWKGGHSLIGSWVRILIHTDADHQPKYGK